MARCTQRALVLAVDHQGRPETTWAFDLQPTPEGHTRLLVRNRTGTSQVWQELIEPGVFFMENGMMQGIAERATRTAR